jgi:hypothetical protein
MLSPPNNVKELRHFLGIIQYYWDMWARRSEMLAPLTDLVGECGEIKTTRMNKTKKMPWRWDSIHCSLYPPTMLIDIVKEVRTNYSST